MNQASKLTDDLGCSGTVVPISEVEPFMPSAVVYPARLVLGGDGCFIVSFRDIPEAITQGDDFSDMMEMAIDALATAIEFYFEDKRKVPSPSRFQHGEIAIALSVQNTDLVQIHNIKLDVAERNA